MTDNQLNIADQLALQQLNADFAYYLDHHQVKRLAQLFTADAYYRHGTRVSEGASAIEQLFAQRAAGDRVARHVISGLRLQSSGDDMALGQSVVVTWAGNGSVPIRDAAPFLVADFSDQYQRQGDGRWLIAQREISRIFVPQQNSGPIGG